MKSASMLVNAASACARWLFVRQSSMNHNSLAMKWLKHVKKRLNPTFFSSFIFVLEVVDLIYFLSTTSYGYTARDAGLGRRSTCKRL